MKLHNGSESVLFEKLLELLLGAEFSISNSVKTLLNEGKFFLAMLAHVRQEKKVLC